MTPKDKAADARLRRTYGIGLEDYDRMLKEGGGGCWICGKPPKENRRLHVDHDHKLAKVKITAERIEGFALPYQAVGALDNIKIFGNGGTRASAKKAVRLSALRLSVRGLLCWQHNTGLQKFRDNPNHLAKAAEYLKQHHERFILK